MLGTASPIDQHIKQLKVHLELENPILLDVVKSFRLLDKVAYRIGILDPDESFATRVPWWPMIAVLGTFSSGKSTFINSFLGLKLQLTGNQAVDDKFTVVCYSVDGSNRVLPGRALDGDPRFPFYRMSRDIEGVLSGEGQRIDTYMQLKTCQSERLQGKIIIDSPGFDADEQRNSTLKLTNHIIDLSDLVLVFFDARHPESGVMHDTLEHLVTNTINRVDANKFLYILNQIDNAAREDNPEEVFAAWQRALAQKGLTAGRFYSIYDAEAAIPIEDSRLRQRFETKRDIDLEAINERIDQVEVERAYRIIGVLDHTAKTIETRIIPILHAAKGKWQKYVHWLDSCVFGSIAGALLALSIYLGYWQGFRFVPPNWLESLVENQLLPGGFGYGDIVLVCVILIGGNLHFSLRKMAAQTVIAKLKRDPSIDDIQPLILRAFRKNTRPWRTVLSSTPTGWHRYTQHRLGRVLADADRFVQGLNNRFADPSGQRSMKPSTRRPLAGPDKTTPASRHGVGASSPSATQHGVVPATEVGPPKDYAVGGRKQAPREADKTPDSIVTPIAANRSNPLPSV